ASVPAPSDAPERAALAGERCPMRFRRLFVSGAAIGLLLAAAVPVAADGPKPANAYAVTVLVTGPAADHDLQNAWGLTRSGTSPWWIANNGTDSSTVYRADGSKLPIRVGIPDGAPTGTVFNGNPNDFNGDNFL